MKLKFSGCNKLEGFVLIVEITRYGEIGSLGSGYF